MHYYCAECGGEITTADDLITINVDGHAKAAHRVCPVRTTKQQLKK